MIARLRILLVAPVLLLAACVAAPPFSETALSGVDRNLTPAQVLEEGTQGERVLWGGVIIGGENHRDYTDLNVLFFPLDRSQRPDVDQSPQNRFIARYPGYLETMVYAPGRRITVLGGLQGIEEGKVGEAPYRFPVLQVDAIHLWPLDEDSRVRFGVGVGIGVHM